MSQPIVITNSAAEKVYSLIEEENNFNLKLRVFITGGGCSGFRYDFSFDEEQQPDDFTFVNDTLPAGKIVTLLVDPMSFQMLEGAEIDYVENMEGAQFVIRNIKSKSTCGCGSSFDA